MSALSDLAWAKPLKSTPKLLLLALIRRSEGSSGYCRVTIDELAADIGATRMTVFSSTKTLVEAGLVGVGHFPRGPNMYEILFEREAREE